MKKTAVLVSIISFLFVPAAAFAESSSTVNVHTEGSSQSTTCVNGHCTTSGNSGKSTVCINGNCTTSDDGNVHYESDDGHTQIHVNSNTDNVTNTPSSTDTPTDEPEINDDNPKITSDPTISTKIAETKEKVHEVKKHAQKMREDLKQHRKGDAAALSSFLKEEMDSLHKLMENLFQAK